MAEKQRYKLNLEFYFTPNNIEDLTLLQYLISDTIEAIGKNFGVSHGNKRGWEKV